MPDRPTPDDLERLLLGAPRAYTREQVAKEVGLPVEQARAYWRALGFADVGDAVAFTVWDIEALRGVLALVDSGTIDEKTALNLVRALGRMTGRLADWHAETLAAIVERSRDPNSNRDGRLEAAYEFGERLLPEFERLLIYAWRRKLAAAANRLVAIGDLGDTPLLSAPVTVGFADLVSFTRLSRGLSVDELGELVEAFEATSADVIAGGGGRVVKTLGDEVLFVADDAAAAASIACRLVAAIGGHRGLPDIRIGLATGPVATWLGDVFGTPANLAARLTALASRNTVLADGETADRLADHAGFALRALPPVEVQGLGVVTPYEVNRRRDPRRSG
ncbi:MAG TPA: adenylate/guanylate cyclase domain-containing protein [Micromonosporaceae bacterium]|nr:adenylate/guanylate cyclase domain-containing protein [Micromonosporaceae bacterium]